MVFGTMFATTASCAIPIGTVRGFQIQTNRTNLSFPLKLKASLQDYPLASRLIVKNLPYSADETSLRREFSNFGEIAELKVIKDATMKRCKGYAFVQYTSQDDALLALETMDQEVFDGRTIYVEIAKPGRDDFGGRVKSTGPPKKWDLPGQGEVVDCWY